MARSEREHGGDDSVPRQVLQWFIIASIVGLIVAFATTGCVDQAAETTRAIERARRERAIVDRMCEEHEGYAYTTYRSAGWGADRVIMCWDGTEILR